jgi:hypothetical protein
MENMEFLKVMLAERNAKMDATQEKMDTDREERKQKIRAGQEHIKEIMETVCFSSQQTGCLAKRDADRSRSEQDHGFEGKS